MIHGQTAGLSSPLPGTALGEAPDAARLARVRAAADLELVTRRPARPDLQAIDVVRDVLLHCGGLANLPAEADALALACEQAHARLLRRREGLPCLPALPALPGEGVDLAATRIAPVSEALALRLHEGLHYLGSPRPGGTHLGLFLPGGGPGQVVPGDGSPPGALVALASLHPFDLHHLVPGVISAADAAHARVVSRLVALPGAPRNTMSRLLGGVFDWLRHHEPQTRLLVSYNNPNLGFCGTLYRASNWTLAGTERKRADMLLDGAYCSLRELRSRFGSFGIEALRRLLGDRITALPAPAQPLQVYVLRLRPPRGLRIH